MRIFLATQRKKNGSLRPILRKLRTKQFGKVFYVAFDKIMFLTILNPLIDPYILYGGKDLPGTRSQMNSVYY